MKWLEVAVHTETEGVEIVSLILEEMGSGGVSIEDPALIYNAMEKGVGDYYAFSPEMLNQKKPIVKGYFSLEREMESLCQELKDRLERLPLSVAPQIFTREVAEQDWANNWKAFYKPIAVGKDFFIKPTWEKISVPANKILLELDPGMAFGCGNHATTTLCLEFLENCITGGEMVCDVGTGTGILGIAAAKLGARAVLAVDVDVVAVKVAQENVALNQVAHQMTVKQGFLLNNFQGEADVVIANIVADVIMQLAPDACAVLKQGGYFITSGIIAERGEEVLQALKKGGFSLQGEKHQGEWVAYLLRKE